MKRYVLTVLIAALLMAPILVGQKTHSASVPQLARGKYLVEDIGLCGDCHTPHNDQGEPVKEQFLKGAPIDFKPNVPVPGWAEEASNIAGLPGWEKDAAIKFLMTGIAHNGLPARPPMPQFRYNQQDAEAIVAYLKSVGSAKK